MKDLYEEMLYEISQELVKKRIGRRNKRCRKRPKSVYPGAKSGCSRKLPNATGVKTMIVK